MFKSKLSFYSLYYAEAYNKFAGPISASLRLQATQLLPKKCRSGGEPLATVCPIWPIQDLNIRPPAPDTNALSHDLLLLFLTNLLPKTFLFKYLTLWKNYNPLDIPAAIFRKASFLCKNESFILSCFHHVYIFSLPDRLRCIKDTIKKANNISEP